MVAIVAVLHATGTLVHVQAFLQRGILATGLFSADVIPVVDRAALPHGVTFVAADGSETHLDELRGHVLFINLWASWCAPCLAEMPAIDRLHQSHGDRVRFFMVTLDDDPDRGFEHAVRSEFSFPVYRPGSALPAGLYGGVLPTTLVVDAEGRIAVHREGMAAYDSNGFHDALDRLASPDP